MRILPIIILLFFAQPDLKASCDPYLPVANSARVANYKIEVVLDPITKCLDATQKVTWVNHSNETVLALRFYMYQNAFKNTNSTFMVSAEGDVFGDDVSSRGEMDWGWIEVYSAKQGETELMVNARYVHPDDDNLLDETVLEIPLATPLRAGQTVELDMIWGEKIPKIFARSGYERENYYNMVHWFPQVGVWEEDREGEWGWNCHQFHRRTEFYGDFGVYDVSITLPQEFVTGASGCEVSVVEHSDSTKTVSYHVEDVIDFAWNAYPHFKIVEDQWEHVFIRLMIPPEHYHLRHRLIAATKHSLQYMNDNVGAYPYTSLTVVDPPLLGLKSGFMEYPTFITGGSFAIFPASVRTLESLIAHEFCHQYFMGMVASNEKEEPWLDEGFVTFHEDKVMESMYGTDGSLFNIAGYKVNNSSFSRHEFVSLPNPSCGAIARSGWEINDGFKGITYSKTATLLKTMEGMIGSEEFVKLVKSYFEKYKFKHPRGEDLVAHVKEFMLQSSNPNALGDVQEFFDQLVYGTSMLDYAAGNISYYKETKERGLYGAKDKDFKEGQVEELINSKITVYRKGEVILPVEVKFVFEDGEEIIETWSGQERTKIFYFKKDKKVVTVDIDPERKLYLDLNLNNNSLTFETKKSPALKIASKVMYWVNNIVQSIGILI